MSKVQRSQAQASYTGQGLKGVWWQRRKKQWWWRGGDHKAENKKLRLELEQIPIAQKPDNFANVHVLDLTTARAAYREFRRQRKPLSLCGR